MVIVNGENIVMKPFGIAALLVLVIAYAAAGQTVRFTSGRRAPAITFEMANNLVLVKASVGKGREGWFIFDTGAESTVVDVKYAETARMVRSGKTTGTGAAGTTEAGVIRNVSLKVGNVEASGLTVYSLPLSAVSASLGMRVAGIIGCDVISKTVADIDYIRQQLKLHRPENFKPLPESEMLPLRIDGHMPFVDVPLNIRKTSLVAKMEIDTGSTGAVLFNSPFVQKHALTRTLGRTMGSRTGGVGGTGASRVARLERIQFGRSAIGGPIAVLYTGTRGDNASTSFDGLLGGAIFRRFRMTVDIAGKRLFLQPNSTLADPFETDMSGMDLLAAGDDLSTIVVDEVKPASVAAKAGVRGGEIIRTVDGRPVAELGLQQVRELLRKAGEHNVELARGRRVFTVRLKLARVI